MFQFLTANGAKGSLYQNIRPVPNNSPVTVLSDNNLRCNVNGGTGGSTGTVSVAAGSTVSFTADQAVYHQGPVSFYMTKVASAASADGSSDWFKIKEIGPDFSSGQAKWDMSGKSTESRSSCLILTFVQPHTLSRYPARSLLANTFSASNSSASTTPAPHHSSTSRARS